MEKYQKIENQHLEELQSCFMEGRVKKDCLSSVLNFV